MKPISVILLLATLFFSACGDLVEISGFVVDARTRRPVAGAVVVLNVYDRTSVPDTTDASGAFTVSMSAAGTACGVPPVTVFVTHDGYDRKREIYAVSRDSTVIALDRK
jgi:hypothetical protein